MYNTCLTGYHMCVIFTCLWDHDCYCVPFTPGWWSHEHRKLYTPVQKRITSVGSVLLWQYDLLMTCIGLILKDMDRLKEKLLKPWKGALCFHFRVCLSVCNRATEHTFWPRNLIFGPSDPPSTELRRDFLPGSARCSSALCLFLLKMIDFTK